MASLNQGIIPVLSDCALYVLNNHLNDKNGGRGFSHNEILDIIIEEWHVPQTCLESTYNSNGRKRFNEKLSQALTELKRRGLIAGSDIRIITDRGKSNPSASNKIEVSPTEWERLMGIRLTSQEYLDIGASQPGLYEGNYKVNGYNLIVSGIPGSGKSYFIENRLIKDCNIDPKNTVRTVFHPEYTNVDFVGQMMPSNNAGRPYEFIPGPFSIALKNAFLQPDENHALIIEELNRGDCAAIFGEIFQLLDRIAEGSDADYSEAGRSQYRIYLPQTSRYIIEINNRMPEDKRIDGLDSLLECETVFIPSNLFIFATMNVSDQNVYTMDTAFTRRWNYMRYNGEDNGIGEFLIPCPTATCAWKEFIGRINDKILKTRQIRNAEDKQLGFYFVGKDDLFKPSEAESAKDVQNPKMQYFINKVLGYIWTNVAPSCRDVFFKDLNSFNEVARKYEKVGLEVFNNLFDDDIE